MRQVAALVLGVSSVFSITLYAQIQPLTLESGKRAARIDAHDDPLNVPMVMRLKRLADAGQHTEVLRLGEAIDAAPFRFHVMTPFLYIVMVAEETKRTHAWPKVPPFEELNAHMVEVVVSPGKRPASADQIESVVINRGEIIVRPVKSEKTADRGGTFTFDYWTFAPDTPITFVFTGQHSTFEWTMTTDEMLALK